MRSRVPDSLAGRIALGVVSALVVAIVLGQLLLPGIGERTISDRLIERGGEAEVSIGATPALRLLWGAGDRVEVDASALDLELSPETGVPFDRLDKFGEVRIAVADSSIGPVALDSFTLERSGDGPYAMALTGTSSLAGLASAAEIPGSGLMGSLLGITGLGSRELDLDFAMQIASEDGSVRVVDGCGEVGGVPTGPLAEILVAAIAVEFY
ncbi:hypothetical protein BH24ACT23_BH24ACT23_11210 [soil metagenome]